MPTKAPSASGRTFSAEQRKAIEPGPTDRAVFAGAGSGKTTVLVERYLRAAKGQAGGADAVLAITFTEKAASEMKERLIRACEEKGDEGLRRQLENAPIGTIHGFCARLLKDYPVEAGIDPFFQVLTEGEADLLMDRVLDSVSEEEPADEWVALACAYGEDEVRSQLKRAYAVTRSCEDPGSPWRIRPRAEEAAEGLRRWRDAVRSAAAAIASDPKRTEAAGRLAQALRAMDGLAARVRPDWPSVREVLAAAAALTLRIPRYRANVREIKAAASAWCSLAAEELALPDKAAFSRLFGKFRSGYEALKRSLARYDFEDLLCLSYELLTSDAPVRRAVRERTRDRFAQILVDEYQDTSPMQAAIIRSIGTGRNLFAVGDPQQSIYGFRHADPQVFVDLVRSGGAERVTLTDNYRSRREILSFVNGLFEGLFPRDTFSPLVPRKAFPPASGPCVEWVCVQRPKGRDESLDRARVSEARLLARRIRQLVDEGWTVGSGEKARPCRYGDFALLLRKSTAVHLYEKELTDLSIPYHTVRGRGFFEKREVTDLICLLQILEDPCQDIPLAAVLRSPLVGISDDGLLALALAAKTAGAETPLFASASPECPARLGGADLERWKEFLSWYGELSAAKDRLGLSRTLEEALRRTAYEAVLRAGPAASQRLANVRKLLELAQRLESGGSCGVGDFVAYVKGLSEREVVEPEARLAGAERDAVFVSTVHAAKGLEFPCVIAADLGGKPGSRRKDSFILSPKQGFGCRVRDPQGEWEIDDATAVAADADAERAEREEEARLLYVAFTRAKEKLILSGSAQAPLAERDEDENESSPADASWIERLASEAGVDWTSGSAEREFAGVRMLVHVHETPPSAPAPAESVSAPRPVVPVDWTLPAAPERGYPETEDRSVTQLLSALAPTLEPEPDGPADDGGPDAGEADAAPGNEYGKVFHKLLEWLAEDAPVRIPLSLLSSAPVRRLTPGDRDRLAAEVRAFWDGPRGAELRSASRLCPELPFLLRTPGGLLKGQIDLVYRSRAGEWVILDYKTNRVEESGLDALAGKYRHQIGMYAYVFWRLYGERPREAALYFSSCGRERVFRFTEEDLRGIGESVDEAFARLKARR